MSIRTRFAPSPTGNVHIGNIRVAIYNWIFARHHHGSFLLRVEDTDQERSNSEAIQVLFDTMNWLGLNYDEEPLYQSKQKKDHLRIANDLLKKGLAYREDKGNTGEGECIIFRMPNEDITFEDQIRGSLTKSFNDLEDFVIVRSDGTPVFHLANVVDDIKQGITHVIRGDDHIENTFRHVALYRALNEDVPIFAHLPMIINQQGKPYSKRDGDAFVGDFKQKGFLSDALFNYLTLLGWSPGDNKEIMSKEVIINKFDLDRCQSSAAQMDIKKLTWMNGEYLLSVKEADFNQEAIRLILEFYPDTSISYIHEIIPLIRERIKTYSEIISMTQFLFSDSYDYNEDAVTRKIKQAGVKEILQSLSQLLKKQTIFDEESLKKALHDYVEESEKGFGTVMVPLRIAVSGKQGGPDLCSILSLLGKDTVLDRIEKTINKFLT